MPKISLLLLIFLIASCLPQKEVEVFEARNYVNWLSTLQTKVLIPKHINSRSSINRPAGIWLGLLRISSLGKNGVRRLDHCLFYRVPSKKLPGILRVIEVKKNEPCKEYENNKNELIGVDLLKVFLSEKRLRINENDFLEADYLHLNFKYRGIEKWLKFPLLNREKEVEFKRYENSSKARFHRGLLFLPLDEENPIDSSVAGYYWGNTSDSYKERSAKICHKMGKDCREEMAFECERCKYGWYEVVDYRCPQGGSKYCSPNNCGEAGEPACPRGFDYLQLITDIVQDDICFQDSPYGFCKRGLRTYCDENHVLICL